MSFMPFHVPKLGLRGLLSLVPLAAGAYCLVRAFDRRKAVVRAPLDSSRRPRPRDADGEAAPLRGLPDAAPWALGLNRETGLLLAGLGLLGWSLGGGRRAALSKNRRSGLKPLDGTDRRLRRPDGTELHVETYGPPEGLPIIFVHGLGSDCDEWFEIRQMLDGRHRLVDWDLAGLGASTPPRDGDWSIERAARDLEAVLEAACDRPAVLVGHSLGGMILLTYCRLFPESLGRRVAGLVLAHTTYTNPMKTDGHPVLSRTLQAPFVEPLCYLTIGLSPLMWPLSVLTYLTGEAHRSLAHSLFTGGESREVLDFLAHYFVEDRPEAIARYSLAMLRYDETATLGSITVPTLVVVGDRDDSCTPAAHVFMRDHIPGARMLTLSPAKHGGLLEHPRQFAEELEKFVAECAAG
jgi:pimeloyl-ACP methyl ester carboxylesterase